MRSLAVVGNDVVDLADPEALPAALHPRFGERVLAPGERVRVAQASEPAALLWAHFAAKEAAYKAVSKLRPGVILAHRLFEVSADLRSVRLGELVLQLTVERTPERVHAIAFQGAPPLRSLQAMKGDPSEEARRLLRELLGGCLGCDPEELAVIRPPDPARFDGLGPPRVLLRGGLLDVDVSLSHHGRFAACAVALPVV